MNPFKGNWNRRRFIQTAGSIAALGVAEKSVKLPASTTMGVSLVVDPADSIAAALPAIWAAKELERSLVAKHVKVLRCEEVTQAHAGDLCIVAAGSTSPMAKDLLRRAGTSVAAVPEALGLAPGRIGAREVLLACGSDQRGLVYALLELADRVDCGAEPLAVLEVRKPIVEHPANRVRSVNRCFQSVVEDKPWYNDRSMWTAYLTMLVSQRFNRFNLSLGLGYDYPQPVSDAYLYFSYPFLVRVPGYDVRAVPLPDQERDGNLEMLRFVSDEAAARGMDFQLGLWNHAYQWPKNSHASYMIEGLTPKTHAPYCRDALLVLLKACPGINGITLRVHGESGIPEGDFSFWQTVFEGIGRLDRKIEVNMHAKGISQRMIDIASATRMPMTLSPKYWAEHLGLPYQPSSIRDLEMPPRGLTKPGFFELSSGARRFLRYSYGDLFKKNRPYDVFFRIWPGTQRVLLWGDPALAAGDGRAMTFCGSLGVDLFEPLSFKGRGGSGLPGGRCSYADSSLTPRFDWEKFLYSYRVWGRHIYNPDADPEGCHRFLGKQFRAAAPAAAQALANASRILRVVTTVHEPSAANWTYWPEIYTNMSITDASLNHLYRDTPSPKVFDYVSPLDPALFSPINDCVSDLLTGNVSSRYSPLEAAQWLEGFANSAERSLAEAKTRSKNSRSPEFRRMAVDIFIQSSLGKFFAWKIRSGVLYGLYEQTQDRSVLKQSLSAYRRARLHWAEAANHAKDVYMADITYGPPAHMRGNWLDRLPAIDADIAFMEARLSQTATNASAGRGMDQEKLQRAVREVFSPPSRPSIPCRHIPPSHFQPGRPQAIELQVERGGMHLEPSSVRLNYRHVNQGEYYQSLEMQSEGSLYRTVIPAGYTNSPYPLQYFFELHAGPAKAWVYPGLGRDLTDRPYFVVEQS